MLPIQTTKPCFSKLPIQTTKSCFSKLPIQTTKSCFSKLPIKSRTLWNQTVHYLAQGSPMVPVTNHMTCHVQILAVPKVHNFTIMHFSTN